MQGNHMSGWSANRVVNEHSIHHQTQEPSLVTSHLQTSSSHEPFWQQSEETEKIYPTPQSHKSFWQQFEEIEKFCPISVDTSCYQHGEYDSRPKFYYKGLGWFHQSLVRWVEIPRKTEHLVASSPSLHDSVVKETEHAVIGAVREEDEVDPVLQSESDSEESLVHSASQTTESTALRSSRADSAISGSGPAWIKKRGRRRRREVQKHWLQDQAKN